MIKFTKAEIDQLLSYCEARAEEGWYTPPREQFERRHKSIVIKLVEEAKNAK